MTGAKEEEGNGIFKCLKTHDAWLGCYSLCIAYSNYDYVRC